MSRAKAERNGSVQRQAAKIAKTIASAPTPLNSFRFGWFAFKLILDRPVKNLHFAIGLSIARCPQL